MTVHHKGLVELGRYLKRVKYRHTAVSPLTHQYNNDRVENVVARNLRDILGWSRPFSASTLTSVEFELMDVAGILVRDGDLWRTTVRWATLGEHLCVHSAYPTLDEDAVFFGPDTYRFARMIRSYLENNPEHAAHIGVAVDIGCGSGAGAILVAGLCPSAQIVAIDINDRALQLTRVNAELAQAKRILPMHSNLLNDVEDQFDLILANPPYMLDAEERTYRHGGGTLGEGLSQRIIETALRRLTPGGTLLLYTGVAIVDGQDPLLEFAKQKLRGEGFEWTYEEIDPDVFSDELLKPAYVNVERIAAVGLTLTRPE